MNRACCEKEKEIIEAFRCGTLDTELRRHARSCAICSDTVAVSEFLLVERTAAAPVLPDADFIWWRAKLHGQRMVMERATRSILLAKKITYFVASVAALWLVLAPGRLQLLMSELSKHQVWSSSGARESALLMGLGALIVTLLGSLYLARSKT